MLSREYVIIRGLGRLFNNIDGMTTAVKNRIMYESMDEALDVIVKSCQRFCPTETGLLKESIGKAVRQYQGGYMTYALVGPRRGYGRDVTLPNGRRVHRIPTRYAHFLEDGTATRAAQPFLRPGLAASLPEFERELISGIQRRIAAWSS